MPLHTIARGSANGEPDGVLVFLHGRGSDEENGLAIAHAVDPEERLLLVAPRAPLALPPGGAHWYQLYKLGFPDPETFEVVAPLLALWLRLLPQHTGIPLERTVLAGFSQGCAMALLTGLRHGERLGGVVGMSGYLPLSASTGAERHPANNATPIFLAHGRLDTVVPIARAVASRDALRTLGYAVEWHEYPMAHSVCAPEIADLNRWLLGRLVP